LLGWLLPWNKHQGMLATGVNAQFYLLIASAVSAFILLIVYRKKYLLFVSMFVVAILFFLYSAPTLRFGLGVLLPLPALLLAIGLGYIRFNLATNISAFVVSMCLVIVTAWSYNYLDKFIEKGGIFQINYPLYKSNIQQLNPDHLIYPPSVMSYEFLSYSNNGKITNTVVPRRYDKLNLNNFEYLLPKSQGMCWNLPLPCANTKRNDVKLQEDGDLSSGFIKTKSY
ncbi:MAG: hypothetical protein ACLFQJ_09480, partial [Campylobacterales bacterium]